MIEDKNLAQKQDDSKEMVTIDYFDRIHKQWIKLDVTKEVANFLKASEQKERRKQNQYNYFNKPIDKIFNESKPENEHFLIDESQDVEKILEKKENDVLDDLTRNYERTLIENSLYVLTPEQREVIEMVMYKNMSQNEIAKELDIEQSSVGGRLKRAKENIKKYIKNNQN